LCLLLVVCSCHAVASAEDSDSEALRVFEERIMPIFKSPKPSSCVQCHLSSVDIKDYILPSHEDTFVALREDGLINIKTPDQSKILTLIRMGDKDVDEKARRIHEATRKAEYDAFASWIKACCRDPELRDRPAPDNAGKIGPQKPLAVVRHARKSRVVESFARNVWSQRMRCFPCHTPHELDSNSPKHKVPIERHADLVKRFGQKMDIFQKSPEATLDRLIAGSRRKVADRYPLLNLEEPQNSLLVLKPTSKLPPKNADGEFEKPSSMIPVTHMGGLKMHVNDQSYKSITAWIQDYAKVAGNEYVSVDDLPADNWVPTQRVLRLKDVPESWGDLSVVQMFVHAWNAADSVWSKEPAAFTQSLITPRRMVNAPLFLFRDETTSTDGAFPLSPGKYLVKVYLDRNQHVSNDPIVLLSTDDFMGQADIEAHWLEGFPKAEVLSAANLIE